SYGYAYCPTEKTPVFTIGVNACADANRSYKGVFSGYGYNGNIGSLKLTSVKSTCFLAGDATSSVVVNNFPISDILNPLEFILNTDTDGDGINDSATSGNPPYTYIYNLAAPRHINRGINFLFADGSARLLSLKAFITNEQNMWNPQ
ncbi:MAG: hypothetical protein HY350_03575, partial [Candidatus Omnitrophica bacterium]|nr:hypothetical protein [Candidatus Omnitrophota bacterium]